MPIFNPRPAVYAVKDFQFRKVRLPEIAAFRLSVLDCRNGGVEPVSGVDVERAGAVTAVHVEERAAGSVFECGTVG
jgi:hypothetical protein